jgi:hypothetical protein
MKKYKYTYFILCCMAALISCENEEEMQLSVDYTPTPVAAAGGETSFTIHASGKWNASKTTSWIKLTPTTGTGNQTVTITATGNEDETENTPQRTTKIYILSGSKSETLTITQLGRNHPLPPAPVISGNDENQCPAEFTVNLEIAPAEYAVSYVWYKDGEVIPAVTATSYTVTESGVYAVAGVNIAGEEGERSEKTVAINPCILPAPVITTFKNTACEVGLTITAPIEYAVSYTWYKNGAAIPNATTASYTAWESGSYTVAAVNAAGTTGEISAAYPVTITPCPPDAAAAITGANANNCSSGSATSKEANTVELTIPEIAHATSYTWYYDAGSGPVEMQTGTSRSYTVVVSGSYTVKGVNGVGEGALSPVKVVNITPCITLTYNANYNQFVCRKSVLNTAAGNNMVDPFLSIYNDAETKFHAAYPSYNMEYIRIRISAATTMNIGVVFENGASISSINYVFNKGADGTISFTNIAVSASNYVKTLADNLLSYFLYSGSNTVGNPAVTVNPSGNKFRLGWIPNNNGQAGILFGLYLISDPHSYIPGVLTKY